MPTLAECRTLLSRYAGAGNDFISRLNEVRARYYDEGSWKGSKEVIELSVFSDRLGNSIVSLPRGYKAILGGAIRSDTAICSGAPMGIRNEFTEYTKGGPGLGVWGRDFQEVPGRFAIFQEWVDPMFLRFKFETTESAGTIHIRGKFLGDDVYSGVTWIQGEKIDFVGSTTVTSTKKFDALGLSAVKPVTNGRISVYAVEDVGVETLVGIWYPTETIPRRKRFKVPQCDDTSATTQSVPTAGATQFYTMAEIDALFSGSGTITVNSSATHDLVYAAYFQRWLKIIAQSGSGSYTHNFTLDNSTVKMGGVLRVSLEVAASANPVLRFYDNSTGGTLLFSISGDSSNAYFVTLIFTFDGSAWHYEGQEV